MVLWYKNKHEYDYNFSTVSYAYLNRYPNPSAKHVLSSDTIENFIDSNGNLHSTKLISKTGKLPSFIKPLLGNNLNTWIIEKTFIDVKSGLMKTYTSNLDHTKFIRVEEYTTYSKSAEDASKTNVESVVKFSSGFNSKWWPGFRERIENWSHRKFASNLKNSREGLNFVMNKFKEKTSISSI